MRLFNFKKTIIAGTFAAVTLIGTAGITNAQTRREIERQQRIEAERARIEQMRQEQMRQNRRDRNDNDRDRYDNDRDRSVYSNNDRYNNQQRYRVYRNGGNGYYQTDQRGAELLRQAVNRGYQEGFREGQMDRRNRRNGGYYNSNVYRSGNNGYQSYVERSQYQYYFQQGFQRGYEDGYNSRTRYGTNRNGSVSILGSILGSILNIREY